jgi:hypothetical protein
MRPLQVRVSCVNAIFACTTSDIGSFPLSRSQFRFFQLFFFHFVHIRKEFRAVCRIDHFANVDYFVIGSLLEHGTWNMGEGGGHKC